MNQGKLPLTLNLSNQANLCRAKKSELCQFNVLVMLGLDYLTSHWAKRSSIPVAIYIKKTGEIELTGLDEEVLNNQNSVRVYTDKKITESEDEMKGDGIGGSSE